MRIFRTCMIQPQMLPKGGTLSSWEGVYAWYSYVLFSTALTDLWRSFTAKLATSKF